MIVVGSVYSVRDCYYVFLNRVTYQESHIAISYTAVSFQYPDLLQTIEMASYASQQVPCNWKLVEDNATIKLVKMACL